jgi:hypothetical protein
MPANANLCFAHALRLLASSTRTSGTSPVGMPISVLSSPRSHLCKPFAGFPSVRRLPSNINNHLSDPSPRFLPKAESVASRRLDLVVENVTTAVDRLAADRGRHAAARRVQFD